MPEIIRAIVFQFYDSPIKSDSGRPRKRKSEEFQFYDSPIKSLPTLLDWRSFVKSFNSMIVRLKEDVQDCTHVPEEVSILW